MAKADPRSPTKPRKDETSRDMSFGTTLPVSGCTASNALAKASLPFGIGSKAARCLTFDRQVPELQIRLPLLNRYTALGRGGRGILGQMLSSIVPEEEG